MNYLLCLFTLLAGCGAEREGAHVEPTSKDKLKAKMSLYCELSKPHYETHKYVVSECDGLLFTALHGLACDYVTVDQFESDVEPGQWFRNPKHDCFQTGNSDSDISKDMLTGLAAFLQKKGDLNAVERTITYGEKNNWFMGDAKDPFTRTTKTLLLPAGQKMFRDIRDRLQLRLTTDIAEDDGIIGINTGFEAHLDVLGIMVRAATHGSVYTYHAEILKAQAERQPRNAFFQAASSRFEGVERDLSILLDESYFPSDHLPTNANYCADYLWQRDDKPSDWSPCQGDQVKSGTDYIVAAYLATGGFGGK